MRVCVCMCVCYFIMSQQSSWGSVIHHKPTNPPTHPCPPTTPPPPTHTYSYNTHPSPHPLHPPTNPFTYAPQPHTTHTVILTHTHVTHMHAHTHTHARTHTHTHHSETVPPGCQGYGPAAEAVHCPSLCPAGLRTACPDTHPRRWCWLSRPPPWHLSQGPRVCPAAAFFQTEL